MDPQPERKKDFGRRVEVYWPDDYCYYRATVVNFSNISGKHQLHYDDGYVERIVITVSSCSDPQGSKAFVQPSARSCWLVGMHLAICTLHPLPPSHTGLRAWWLADVSFSYHALVHAGFWRGHHSCYSPKDQLESIKTLCCLVGTKATNG